MIKHKSNIAAALVIAVFAFAVVYFQWFAGMNLSLQDTVYQKGQQADPSIKIVAIDEKTLEALGQFETWTREPYARLIELLNEGDYAPKAIGLDILLINEKGEEDQLLVEACRKYSNVVMASNLVFSAKIESEGGRSRVNPLHIEMVELPFGELSGLVRTGFVNTVQDSLDNSVRYTILEFGDYRSFACEIVRTAAESDGETYDAAAAMPTDGSGGIFIDYTGGPETYETLSMIDVLEGKIPAAAFADSIVLVGAHAAGMGDSYSVPIQKGTQMYGVEIHANIIQSLQEQRCLIHVSRLWNGICCAALVFVLTLLSAWVRPWISLLAAGGMLAAQYALCTWLDEKGIVVNLIALPVSLAAAILWSVTHKYAAEVLQKRKIMHAFRKYVAPQVVEEIARNHNYQLKLGGEKRHIAVLFVDIRGFTPLSEALEPEQVVEILNEYLELVTEAVFRNGGTLDKFIGDAAMAVFNAPFDSEDYIYRAVCAARDIAAGSDGIAEKFMKRFGKRVSYGIGVNCGDAVVGNIGSEFRMDYTAIGDTVNTAARLEANAKAGQILISEFVYDSLRGRIEAAEIGEIPLKGKSRSIMVYALERVRE